MYPFLSLFAITLFTSAFLLFWVQLMIAKLILPLLGGSPAVWNTCLFFFQFLLLMGYGYAHLSTVRWHERWHLRHQIVLHVGLLLVPLLFLPIALPNWTPPITANPIGWLLLLLLRSVGLPFLMISTTAPLLQRWFASTEHAASKNPYTLYAASNLGSLLGLISYPVLLEPTLPLTQQCWLWAGGYGLFVLLVTGCAIATVRSPLAPNAQPLQPENPPEKPAAPPNPPTIRQQAQWVVLAFLPSSLLLGVTTYLTTDIASIPFLWALPLALYLLTFVLTFGQLTPKLPGRLVALLPLVLIALIGLCLLQMTQPTGLVLPLHLIGFFVTAYLFHQELARTKPDPEFLTLFYFWVSVGGVLGGWFNAIAAPLVFPTVLEYPLALTLSLLLLPQIIVVGLRFTLPLSVGLLLGMLLIGFSGQAHQYTLVGGLLALGLTGGISYLFGLHPARWIVGFLLVVLLGQFSIGSLGGVIATDRSFFGVYRVLRDRQGYNSLLHGTTLHGKQSLDPTQRREPLTYFSRTGPIGQLFAAKEGDCQLRVGVLGLGIGTLAAYANVGQEWTFYEIDPTDEQLARRYFTFLQDAPVPIQVISGDGRLALKQAPANSYDVLVMDAFSSDSIPIHLVTREAVQLYLSKLSDRGLLAINISNRYLDLETILGSLAQNLGLSSLHQLERTVTDAERKQGKSPSQWVLLARSPEVFGSLQQDSRWHPLSATADAPLWTDDFSDIFRVLRAVRRSPGVS